MRSALGRASECCVTHEDTVFRTDNPFADTVLQGLAFCRMWEKQPNYLVTAIKCAAGRHSCCTCFFGDGAAAGRYSCCSCCSFDGWTRLPSYVCRYSWKYD
ncbi:hypothetical protein [Desulfosporosinus sp. HMP52]|uniref:hypothetical protein n=1 Tax=Desulfosporosinus sp. HMP52 TaxID=1487923 RepID=UPI0013F4BC5D|nr:hypothetical protein [Desulfosporosinus sp. HMP52]